MSRPRELRRLVASSSLILPLLGCPQADPVAPWESKPRSGCEELDPEHRPWVWADADGDGWGVGPPVQHCPGPGYADRDGDCDDGRAHVNPGGEIPGDGIDNDCDPAFKPRRFPPDVVLNDAAWSVQTFPPDQINLSAVAGVGDMDGDGLEDVLFGGSHHSLTAEYSGGVYLFTGGSVGARTLDDARVVVPGAGERAFSGWATVGAGDLDADGHPDALVFSGSSVQPLLALAGPSLTTLATLPPAISSSNCSVWPGRWADGVGDVDGDGFDDVVTSDIAAGEACDGEVYLFRGPLQGQLTPADAWATWVGQTAEPGADYSADMLLGEAVAGLGDVTGDGWPDIGIAARNDARGGYHGGAVHVLTEVAGGRHAWSDAEASLFSMTDVAMAGRDVAGGDDVNGDGDGDLLVSGVTWPRDSWYGPSYAAAWLVLGPIAGERALEDADLIVEVVQGWEADVGAGVALPGDMDGDGFGEVAIGIPYAYGAAMPGLAGAVALFYGPAEGRVLWSDADTRFWGGNPGKPGRIDAAGDFNGDGYPDLVVVGGAPSDLTDSPSGFILFGGDP